MLTNLKPDQNSISILKALRDLDFNCSFREIPENITIKVNVSTNDSYIACGETPFLA